MQANIQKHPAIVNYEKERLLELIQWHKKTLDISGTKLAHLITTYQLHLGGSSESKEAKVEAVKRILGLDNGQGR